MKNPLRIEMHAAQGPGFRAFRHLGVLLLIALWFYPWAARLRYPLILSDDVNRIQCLQTQSLGERLTRPFNEHLAPFFELVTAAAWEATGHALAHVPAVFTATSYVPFALCLPLLWLLIWREWGSPLTASFAVSLFAATPVYAECVHWFSASTFMWALVLTFAALILAGGAFARGTWRAWAGVGAACLLAPMASSIGLLAGPACTLRGWPARDRRDARGMAQALLPSCASIVFVAIASLFRLGERVRETVDAPRDLARSLSSALAAPAYLVFHGFGGIHDPHLKMSAAVLIALSVVGLACIAVRCARARAMERRWLAVGSFFIVGGYLLTYCVRTHIFRADVLPRVQRYHLFPCVGLILVIAAIANRALRTIERRALPRAVIPIVASVVLILVSAPLMARRLSVYRRNQDQTAVFAALDRVSTSAARHGYATDDVIAAFEPIEPAWAYDGCNLYWLLPRLERRIAQAPDPLSVRATIFADIEPASQRLLLAGTNVSRHLYAVEKPSEQVDLIPGELVRRSGVRRLSPDRSFQFDGWSSFLEYRFGAALGAVNAIDLGSMAAGQTVELWWKCGDEAFSRSHSVVIRAPEAAGTSWRLPLDRIPLLDARQPRAVRILARRPGEVVIDDPVLTR